MRRSLPVLPLGPLLRAYLNSGLVGSEALGRLPGWGPRFRAIQTAAADFFNEPFLDGAAAGDFQAAITTFYQAVVPYALHVSALSRRADIVRHALAHLLRGSDPLPQRLERCLTPGGAYFVPGLGPTFWSALVQALDPQRHAAWTPSVLAGLRRLGLVESPGCGYAALLQAYQSLLARDPALTALHVDHFLSLVAAMSGRDLFSGAERAGPLLVSDLAAVIRHERARTPLRHRLQVRGRALPKARGEIDAGLARQDGPRLATALALADPTGWANLSIDAAAHAETLALWVGRLWEADDPYERLDAFWRADPIRGAGMVLPIAVLQLRNAQSFFPWDDATRRGYALLDDAADGGKSAAERYRLFNEGVLRLCEQLRLHPLEAPAVLAALADGAGENPPRACPVHGAKNSFSGFSADTFHFLVELQQNNRRGWMEQQRERYRFAVRDPLVELCRELAGRYIRPILHREWGWELETAARSGRALTSICKNDYGRSVPYHTALWITFYRRGNGTPARREGEAQFFVRLDSNGLHYGFCLGPNAGAVARQFRVNVQAHAELVFRALAQREAIRHCRCDEANNEVPAELSSPDALRAWVAVGGRRPLTVAKTVPAGDLLLRSEELVGDILLTFDALVPLFACAVEADPRAVLTRRAGRSEGETYTEADFRRATFLGDDWLRRARTLMGLKRQLVLQGVPGTGKTHVARCLARLLTGGRDDAVRLVQFHPAYSYEEFVEGIKVQTIEVNGRSDISYPVADGLLCAFAAEAARRPDQPHVLLIDEINRGNLPRIFGELLYLLEYREQAVGLPYSRRSFRLPANLYVIGTMNAADRSVALVDRALRRRFSFLDMPPDAAVLAAWLRDHPPRGGPAFADEVVALFRRLNARLLSELGPGGQVGHSFFMVSDLDETCLRVVWEHHIGPLLEEHFAGQPGRAAEYGLEALRRSSDVKRRPKQPAAELAG